MFSFVVVVVIFFREENEEKTHSPTFTITTTTIVVATVGAVLGVDEVVVLGFCCKSHTHITFSLTQTHSSSTFLTFSH